MYRYMHTMYAYKQLRCVIVCSNTECADSGLVVEDRLECLLNLSAEKVLQAVPWKLWRNLHFYRLPLKTEQSAIIALVDGRRYFIYSAYLI